MDSSSSGNFVRVNSLGELTKTSIPNLKRDYRPKTSVNSTISSSRDEMNLSEFPLTVLSKRIDPKIKTLEFTDTVRIKSTGQVIKREWVITGTDKFGLPTSTDDDVLLGLMRLTMDQGFRSPKVYFTRYELMKVLRWSTEGRSYTRLTRSLDRLSGVRVKASNGFFDNQSKSYQTLNFGILDAYEIYDSRGGTKASSSKKEELGKSFFVWSEKLFESFQSGYIKKLDLDFYFSLKSAVSRRLYRYLDKYFFYRPVVEVDLMTLAFEKLGLSRNYKYISSVRQQLEPAFEELVERRYLDRYEIYGKGKKKRVSFYSQGSSAAQVLPTEIKKGDLEPVGEKESLPVIRAGLVESLVKRGVALNQACRLMNDKSFDACKKVEKIINFFDELKKKSDRRISQNPAGFLYRAVENSNNFVLPSNTEVKKRSREGKVGIQKKGVLEKKRQEFKLYQEYLSGELARRIPELSPEEIDSIQDLCCSRLKIMKGVVSQERYEQAVEKAIEEELRKRFFIADFREWGRGR